MPRSIPTVPFFAGLALVACSRGGPPNAAPTPNANAVKVEFFVTSQCPAGTQAENSVREALEKLGPAVDFKVDFLGSVNDGGLSSLRGPDEVTGDLAQVCALKHSPATFLAFLACQNRDPREVARSWAACANEVKASTAKIKTCLEGAEGKALLTESFARSTARGAKSSPTMFVAGQPYSGGRSPTDFLRAICAAAPSPKPAVCLSL